MSFGLKKSKKAAISCIVTGLKKYNKKISSRWDRDAPNLQGGQAVELISLVVRHEVSHLERWEAITFKKSTICPILTQNRHTTEAAKNCPQLSS